MTHDIEPLRRLGKRSQRLRAELDELRPQLVAAVREALDAGAPLAEVIKASGYTRDAVYKISRGVRGASR